MYSNSATLDDVEFLVGSANRLAVLDAISAVPRARHELREVTDASRVTLSRVLSDLEERNWIVRTGETYETTTEGAVVAAEFARLFANVEAIDGLADALGWLPVDEFDFELASLAEASLIASTDRDLTAAITHTADRVREATRVRNVATGISSEVADAYLEAAAHDDRSLETVVHASVFDAAAPDGETGRRLRAMVEAENLAVRRFDGAEPPVMLTVCDDVVLLCGRSDSRSPPEGVESTNGAVRAWADSYFESLRCEAKMVRADPFTA